jgi:hypothetical protein
MVGSFILRFEAMPRKEKIKLAKVLASLNTVCPKCEFSIPPEKCMRVDSSTPRLSCKLFPKFPYTFSVQTAPRFLVTFVTSTWTNSVFSLRIPLDCGRPQNPHSAVLSWKQHELPNFCPQDFGQLARTCHEVNKPPSRSRAVCGPVPRRFAVRGGR